MLGAEPVVSASLRSEPAPLDRLPQALAYRRLLPCLRKAGFVLREGKKDLVYPWQGLLIRDF